MEAAVGLAAGFALLALGGEALVRGAVAAALALGVSPLLVGLVVVGFGTSTPELVTSLTAAMRGAPGLSVGAVVGSNVANSLLVLGIAGLIGGVTVAPDAFRRDGFALGAATAAAVAVLLSGEVGRAAGAGLVLGLGAYVAWAARSESGFGRPAGPGRGRRGLAGALALAVLGTALTVAGARLLVGGAVALAAGLGVSDAVVGLAVVALGTSLPELAACALAAWRGHPEVALGNVLGSNLFNLLGILGATALVRPLPVPAEVLEGDAWVLAAATTALLVVLRTGWRLGRREGAAFVAAYGAWIGWLVASA